MKKQFAIYVVTLRDGTKEYTPEYKRLFWWQAFRRPYQEYPPCYGSENQAIEAIVDYLFEEYLKGKRKADKKVVDKKRNIVTNTVMNRFNDRLEREKRWNRG